MTALPDLDRRVAETVMGLAFCDSPMAARLPRRCSRYDDPAHLASDQTPYPYSTDIGTAWTVVERMRALGFDLELNNHDVGPDLAWEALFSRPGLPRPPRVVRALGETAPDAICRAALDAIARTAA